jgi:hypothetical protein
MGRGKVWNVSVDVGTNEIDLNYFPDEACIKGIKALLC